MVFEDTNLLFNKQELEVIKNTWNESTCIRREFSDRSYDFDVLYGLDKKYTNKLLDWFELTVGRKMIIRKEHLILHRFSPGDYFDYHVDSTTTSKGKRLYAVGFNVNEEYTGGEFRIAKENIETTIGSKAGVPYVFSSEVPHKINPVLTGTRWSIILFIHDTAFNEKTLV